MSLIIWVTILCNKRYFISDTILKLLIARYVLEKRQCIGDMQCSILDYVCICNIIKSTALLTQSMQCRPVLHQNAVTFFWSFGIMDCMLLTYENGVRYWSGIFQLHWWTVSIKQRLLILLCGLCFFRTSPLLRLISCAFLRKLNTFV